MQAALRGSLFPFYVPVDMKSPKYVRQNTY